jgi:hypothetical protein
MPVSFTAKAGFYPQGGCYLHGLKFLDKYHQLILGWKNLFLPFDRGASSGTRTIGIGMVRRFRLVFPGLSLSKGALPLSSLVFSIYLNDFLLQGRVL